MIETAIHPSETTGISTYATCGVFYSDKAQRGTLHCDRIIQPVFNELWELYDRYIENTDDVPWWYTERSIVGHLTAAAFKAGNLALEEYSNERIPKHDGDSNRQGRVDWWMATTRCKQQLIAETKAIWLSKDARDWKPLCAKLKKAEDQVNEYKDNDCPQRLMMCFTRPYWKFDDRGENSAQRKLRLHQNKPADDKYDYCAYYWLNDEYLKRFEGCPNLCPALLIYCKELTLGGVR